MPAFQAVWGGYAALVGSERWGDMNPRNASSRAVFAIRTAQLFVGGRVLGWFGASAAVTFLTSPEAHGESTLFRAAVAARAANAPHLLFGSLARPSVVTGTTALPVPGTVCTVPSVLSGAWRAGGGGSGVIVVLANLTGADQTVGVTWGATIRGVTVAAFNVAVVNVE